MTNGLDRIRELKDGWYDGEGTAYDPAFLDWIESDILPYLPSGGYCYPTVDLTVNGVAASVEYHIPNPERGYRTANATIELYPDKTAEYHVMMFAGIYDGSKWYSIKRDFSRHTQVQQIADDIRRMMQND